MATTNYQTIDEYLDSMPKETRVILEKMRQLIQKTVPEAREAISYQIPAFKLNGKNLIHFSGWKKHVSVYPAPEGNETFNKKLAPYVKGKGTVQFSLDKPIPYLLLKQIVEARLVGFGK